MPNPGSASRTRRVARNADCLRRPSLLSHAQQSPGRFVPCSPATRCNTALRRPAEPRMSTSGWKSGNGLPYVDTVETRVCVEGPDLLARGGVRGARRRLRRARRRRDAVASPRPRGADGAARRRQPRHGRRCSRASPSACGSSRRSRSASTTSTSRQPGGRHLGGQRARRDHRGGRDNSRSRWRSRSSVTCRSSTATRAPAAGTASRPVAAPAAISA